MLAGDGGGADAVAGGKHAAVGDAAIDAAAAFEYARCSYAHRPEDAAVDREGSSGDVWRPPGVLCLPVVGVSAERGRVSADRPVCRRGGASESAT